MLDVGNNEYVGPAVGSHEHRGWMQRGGTTLQAQGRGFLGGNARRAAPQ